MARPWRPCSLRAVLRYGVSWHVWLADHLPAKTLYWAVVRAATITDPTARPDNLTAADLMQRTWDDRSDVGLNRGGPVAEEETL